MKLNSYGKWKNALTSLADDLLSAGEGVKAAALLQNLLTINPGEREARKAYFNALLAAKDFERAKREGLFLSMIYLSEKNRADAVEIFKRLLPHFPSDLNLQIKTAELLLSSQEADQAEALYNQVAERYLADHLPLGAVEIYSKLFQLHPKNHLYKEKIARIYHRAGMLGQAIEEYFGCSEILNNAKRFEEGAGVLERILSIDPAHVRASFDLAETRLKLNKTDEAVELMKRQIENRLFKENIDEAIGISKRFIELLSKKKLPDEANAQRENLASILFEHGREAEAVRLLDQVAEAASAEGRPDKALEIQERILTFYRNKGDRDQSLALYDKMLLMIAPLDINRMKIILDRFIKEFSDQELKGLDSALRAVSKSLKESLFADASDEILTALGDLYAAKNKPEEAIKIYQKIPKASLRLADLYVEEGDAEKAMPLYRDAIEDCDSRQDAGGALEIFARAKRAAPQSAPLHALMGKIHYRRGEWDSALTYYEQALKFDPGSREAVVGTAMTYTKKGMLKEIARLAEGLSNKALVIEIVDEYRKALAQVTTPEKGAMSLGLLFYDLGRYAEAVKEFEKAASDSESFVEAVNHLALCYKNLGQNDAAAMEFKKVLDKPGLSDDETLDLRYNLAVMYEEIGKREEASDLYQDILVSDIGYKDVNQRLRNIRAAGKNKNVIALPKKDKP